MDESRFFPGFDKEDEDKVSLHGALSNLIFQLLLLINHMNRISLFGLQGPGRSLIDGRSYALRRLFASGNQKGDPILFTEDDRPNPCNGR